MHVPHALPLDYLIFERINVSVVPAALTWAFCLDGN